MSAPFPVTNGTGLGMASDNDIPRVLDIEIDPPIEWNGRTYSVLHLEEPTGKMVAKSEQELSNGANFSALRNYQFALVSNCSDTPRAVIEQMRISQIEAAARFLSSFMPGGLGTGGN